MTKNDKKRALFTKKYKKITKNTRFFDAKPSQTYQFATLSHLLVLTFFDQKCHKKNKKITIYLKKSLFFTQKLP